MKAQPDTTLNGAELDAQLSRIIAQRRTFFLSENSHLPPAAREQHWQRTLAHIESMGRDAVHVQRPISDSGMAAKQQAVSQPQTKRRKTVCTPSFSLESSNVNPF